MSTAPASDDLPDQQGLFDAPNPQLPERVARVQDMPQYADIVLTDEDIKAADERWPDASPLMRLHWKKQSILATLRHQIVADPETGQRLFGGVQPNSGRKKRMDEKLVDACDSRQKEIIDAAFAPLGPGNPAMDRHRAAMNLTREAREVREQERKDDELDRSSKEDLIAEAAPIIAQMIRDGSISLNGSGEIVDAEAVET